MRSIGRLARASANNELRRRLRERLKNSDASIAKRALLVLLHVKRPGLSEDDFSLRGDVFARLLCGEACESKTRTIPTRSGMSGSAWFMSPRFWS